MGRYGQRHAICPRRFPRRRSTKRAEVASDTFPVRTPTEKNGATTLLLARRDDGFGFADGGPCGRFRLVGRRKAVFIELPKYRRDELGGPRLPVGRQVAADPDRGRRCWKKQCPRKGSCWVTILSPPALENMRFGTASATNSCDRRSPGGSTTALGKRCKPSDLTIDLMLLADWNELAWYKCGLADLAQGKHRLEIRLQRWFKTANNQREEQQIFYCSDALCISKEPFRPNGKFKPGAPYQDKQDTAAAEARLQNGRRRQGWRARRNAADRPVADRPLGRTDRQGRRPHAADRVHARRRATPLVRHRRARRPQRETARFVLLPSLRLSHAGRRAGRIARAGHSSCTSDRRA